MSLLLPPLTTLVVTDTETTGVDHGDHIWEFAAIVREHNGYTRRYHWFVQHDLDKATRLPEPFRTDHDTRYNPTIAVTPRQLAYGMLPVFAGRPYVLGAVPSFDTERYAHLFRHYGLPDQPWHHRLHDIETLTKGFLAGAAAMGDHTARAVLVDNPTPDDLSRAVGVKPPGPGVRHTAMGDCEWILHLFDTLIALAEFPHTPALDPIT